MIKVSNFKREVTLIMKHFNSIILILCSFLLLSDEPFDGNHSVNIMAVSENV